SLGRHIVKIYDDLSMTVNGTAKPLFVDINDVDIWTGAGSKADYPKSQMYVYLLNQTSGRYDCDIENVSFLRLKQLTLGYNVGERVLNKLKISSARLFITGENLFLLTNYSGLDPELVNPTQGRDNLGSYPLPRKFTVGLSVNF
ncbi:MAG: SusC/RagA family TonB-linked outer membrane protein, partial [Butyricimonas virosa]